MPKLKRRNLGSLDHRPAPNYRRGRSLGSGQTGFVDEVELESGEKAALKCSYYPGRYLLKDYGALLDLQETGRVPEVLGWYKEAEKGDCYLMETLGPSLLAIREANGDTKWPDSLLASIGVSLLNGIESFSTSPGHVMHGDSFAGNILLSAHASGSCYRHRRALFFVDFDLSKRMYLPEDLYPEVRQVMYTILYLARGDSFFLQIYDHRSCDSGADSRCTSQGVDVTFCALLRYACTLTPDESSKPVDFVKMRNALSALISSGPTHIIQWPEEIVIPESDHPVDAGIKILPNS